MHVEVKVVGGVVGVFIRNGRIGALIGAGFDGEAACDAAGGCGGHGLTADGSSIGRKRVAIVEIEREGCGR